MRSPLEPIPRPARPLPTRRRALLAVAVLLSSGPLFAADPMDASARLAAAEQETLESLASLGNELRLRGRWDDAGSVLNSALEIAEHLDDRHAGVRFQVLLARALTDAASHRVESFEPALVVARKALAGARELRDPGLEGEALERLAQALYHRRLWRGEGDWDEIHALYEKALEKAVESGRRTAEAESTFHVGLLRERLGRPEEAIEHYRRALDLATAEGDDLLRSYALRHLAFSDPTLSPERTLEIHRQVLALREQAGAATGLLYGNLAVAGALSAQGSFDEARDPVDRGCAIADEIGSLRGRVSCQLTRGRIEILSGSVRQGAELCRAAGEKAAGLGLDSLAGSARRCLELAAAD